MPKEEPPEMGHRVGNCQFGTAVVVVVQLHFHQQHQHHHHHSWQQHCPSPDKIFLVTKHRQRIDMP